MNRIRELREDRDLQQTEVAKGTGINQKTLSNYETGKTNPDSYAVIALARFFDVTTDYLLGVSDRNLKDRTAVLSAIEDMERCLADLKRHIRSL